VTRFMLNARAAGLRSRAASGSSRLTIDFVHRAGRRHCCLHARNRARIMRPAADRPLGDSQLMRETGAANLAPSAHRTRQGPGEARSVGGQETHAPMAKGKY
jgi:hypothetical protein